MTFKTYAFMAFLLTPIALIQNVFAYMFIHFAFFEDSFEQFGMVIFAIIVVLLLELLLLKLRFKELADCFYIFLIDLPFAIVRLPLQLIANTIALVAFFKDIDVDPTEMPDLEFHGIIGYFTILLFQTESHEIGRAHRERQERDAEASDDPREYKWQAFFFHLKLWFITLFHSALLWGLVFYFCYSPPVLEVIGLVGAIVIPFLALVIFGASLGKAISMRQIRETNDYYDNTTTTTKYYEWNEEEDEIIERGTYTRGPGWRSFFSIQVVLFSLTSPLWIVPQTIAVLVALLVPPDFVILSVRHQDINKQRQPLYNKILHDLFGFIIDN